MQWICLRLSLAPEHSDLASHLLHEAGCEGVQIEDVVIRDRGEDADLVPREEVVITGYCELKGDAVKAQSKLQSLLAEYSLPAWLEVGTLDSQDWANSWRENFPPLEIGDFLIAPSWEEVSQSDERILIRLDPGLAFGTGQHPTTQMCLELLGNNASRLRGACVLDVGCGSGVLSIAAAKLGARVTASDFDPHCVAATRENAVLNGVEDKIEIVQAAGLDWCEREFDVVVANLMSDLLIRLVPNLSRVVSSASTLIVSGISSPRAYEVEAALQNAGFARIEKREREGETRGDVVERWTAFVMANR